MTFRCSSHAKPILSWKLNLCFQIVVLEKTLESPLDFKEIKSVNPKRKSTLNIHWKDWYWSYAPMLWPPDLKSWLIGKDPDAGKGWRQEEKGMTEDEMVGWHHRLDGHVFEQLRVLMMDREAWRAAVHVITKSRTQLTDSHCSLGIFFCLAFAWN